MREYGQIQSGFWTHLKIRPLDSETKLLAAYLLTGPHTNGLGCYHCPEGYVCADLKLGIETVSKAFRNLIDIGFCLRCDYCDWILIPDFLEWNKVSNPKIAAARIREARELPRQSVLWPTMVAAIHLHASKHLPKDFKRLLEEEWLPQALRIPKVIKMEVLATHDPICAECGATDDLTFDHIRPVCYGGRHTVANLRILCRSCNAKWFPNHIETLSKPYRNKEQEQEQEHYASQEGTTPTLGVVTTRAGHRADE